jgi:hypothetical protein
MAVLIRWNNEERPLIGQREDPTVISLLHKMRGYCGLGEG